ISALEAAAPGQTERIVEREIRVEVPPGGDGPSAAAAVETADAKAPPTFGSMAELATAYRDDFRNEPVDATWSHEAESSYGRAIADALPTTSRVVSFECRSRFCDLEVVHDTIDVSNGFLLDLFALDRNGPLARSSGGFRAGVPTEMPDGKLLYHVYVARPG